MIEVALDVLRPGQWL